MSAKSPHVHNVLGTCLKDLQSADRPSCNAPTQSHATGISVAVASFWIVGRLSTLPIKHICIEKGNRMIKGPKQLLSEGITAVLDEFFEVRAAKSISPASTFFSAA